MMSQTMLSQRKLSTVQAQAVLNVLLSRSVTDTSPFKGLAMNLVTPSLLETLLL